MAQAFKRLEKVLQLEAQQGYKNQAVVGGIRQFAVFWVEQARQEAVDEADRVLVEQVAEVLADYGRLPGVEARARAIRSLQESLKRRAERLARLQTSKKSPASAPTSSTQTSAPQPLPTTPSSPEPVKPAISETSEQGETAVSPHPEPEPTPATSKPTRRKPHIEPDIEKLQQPVTQIKGVGPKLAQLLGKLGVTTILDLLYLFPRRYDDYSQMKPIKDLEYGETVTIIGTIWQAVSRRSRSNQVYIEALINDGTGQVRALWFNQPWLVDKLKAGLRVAISGKVEQDLGRPLFKSPEWEPVEIKPLRTRMIVPVYPLTQGLSDKKLRAIVNTAVTQWTDYLPDPLPEDLRQKYNLLPLHDAIRQIHMPDSQESLHEARRRLAFDELFLLQLGIQGQRRTWQANPGIPLQADPVVLDAFRHSLPYQLTGAQERVIAEIAADMARDIPMNRLLQGDVGAGKTVVAAAAMLIAAKAGAQAAMMAPTEILAEQHYHGLSKLLEPLGVTVCLLTGSLSAAEKRQVYEDLANGQAQVAIGTHALIQSGVTFHRLGLVVIDEQHRFGVEQRKALREKGVTTENGRPNPHLLTMSATPIPRSLALSLYGDLDLSILDEMPPGRQEIATRWIRPRERERAYAFLHHQVKQGRQAYIIYPLVEESDKIDAEAAVSNYKRLQEEIFPDLRIGLVHGRMSADEKESVMRAFYKGEIDILVATSVIEVGVDVPNSTVMMIENANRFGLAQLHQFRGRVGRGAHKSYCILVADNETAESEERLRALEQTNDGFALAEKDLELRGPGEFFGHRQSGLPELRMASLLDLHLLETARTAADAILATDPDLQQPEHYWLRQQVTHFWEKASDIS